MVASAKDGGGSGLGMHKRSKLWAEEEEEDGAAHPPEGQHMCHKSSSLDPRLAWNMRGTMYVEHKNNREKKGVR